MENERASEIIERLVKVGNASRIFSIVGVSVLLGSALAVAGRLLVGPSLGWALGLLGVILGYVLGGYLASLLAAILEWMAQMLIEARSLRGRGG